MARTRHLHPLLAEHRTLVRDVRQLSHTLQTTAERLTATLQQTQAQLDALRAVRRWAEEILAQGGTADDA